MNLQVVGCSHHNSSVELRERLAFRSQQIPLVAGATDATDFPRSEVVLLSTCNRTELYTAGQKPDESPSHQQVVTFLADFHGLDAADIFDDLIERKGEDAVRHLFTVAASLDSMVVGEAQILSQVKQAYQTAHEENTAGPLTHSVFQASIRVAKRVASETAIHQKRVSIPSIAVADFAKAIFERLDDKKVLVIGAGEMGEETLRYLMAANARDVTTINRNHEAGPAIGPAIRRPGPAVAPAASAVGGGRPGDQHDRSWPADRHVGATTDRSKHNAISALCLSWILPCRGFRSGHWRLPGRLSVLH